MIRYSLRCRNDHSFDSWFRNAAECDTLSDRGHVACPECGSVDVAKALMAPTVRPAEREARADLSAPMSRKEAALAALRKHLEENSDNVGMNFAAEARAMHDGLIPDRPIHGEAKPDEARALIEDGVPVAPLPFLPARRVN